MVEADIKEYYKSIGMELQSIKNRVRNIIGDANWLEDGRYKEAILKNAISRFLPQDISIGTGFIAMRENEKITTTRQIDLILYDNIYPTLFKEGDFVILTPEPVMGLIEVKTKIYHSGKNSLQNILEKSFDNALMVLKAKKNVNSNYHFFNGLFSFDSEIDCENALNDYDVHIENINRNSDNQNNFLEEISLINNICLNENIFMRVISHAFAAFELKALSSSYFISNLLDYLKMRKMGDQSLWFALPDISDYEVGRIELKNL